MYCTRRRKPKVILNIHFYYIHSTYIQNIKVFKFLKMSEKCFAVHNEHKQKTFLLNFRSKLFVFYLRKSLNYHEDIHNFTKAERKKSSNCLNKRRKNNQRHSLSVILTLRLEYSDQNFPLLFQNFHNFYPIIRTMQYRR